MILIYYIKCMKQKYVDKLCMDMGFQEYIIDTTNNIDLHLIYNILMIANFLVYQNYLNKYNKNNILKLFPRTP